MSSRIGIARQRLTIGRSAAGAPRTYRTLRTRHHGVKALVRGLFNSVLDLLGHRGAA